MVGLSLVDITFIRHAESTNNKTWTEKRDETFRVPGPGLIELGRTQAGMLADWFLGFAPHPIQLFSSPFMRALETAAPLAESFGMDVAVRADPMERSGPLAGSTMEHRHHPGSPRSVLREVPPRTVLPDDATEEGRWKGPFETCDQATERAKNLVTWPCRDFGPDDCVVLVSHGVTGSLLVIVLFRPSELTWRSGQIARETSNWFALDNTSISWFRLFPGDDTELCCFNRVDHLVLTGVESAIMLQPS